MGYNTPSGSRDSLSAFLPDLAPATSSIPSAVVTRPLVGAASHNMDSDIHIDAQSVDVEKTAEIADILRNERRIQVLIALESADDDGLTIGELAEAIAECEHGPGFSPADRKTVYVSLYQTHIPVLAESGVEGSGVVDWDRDVITRGRRFDVVVSALDRLQE